MAISACSLRSSASSSSSSSWAGALDLAENSQYAKLTAVHGKGRDSRSALLTLGIR
jgi:hypothetical protein